MDESLGAASSRGLIEVVPASRAADEDARPITPDEFDRVVHDHQRRIYRILLGFVRDPDSADTLTQECFLRAFERRHTFRGEARIGTWLVRIALNLARDHRRNRQVAFWRRIMRAQRPGAGTDTPVDVADPSAGADRAVQARQHLAMVWAAADRLSSRQRACFLLRFVEAMSLEEIAQALQVEVGTVKSHLARATGAVRRHVAQWEGVCEDI
jgi:RNA polymerase sigma-70 factor (ECF subfamily)